MGNKPPYEPKEYIDKISDDICDDCMAEIKGVIDNPNVEGVEKESNERD